MNVSKNGVTVVIDDAVVISMALERLKREERPLPVFTLSHPAIGEVWEGQGGIYAGMARGRDGAPDYHLIVGPEFDGARGWDAQTQWASSLEVETHKDFRLPYRKEQALCYANVPELFKPESYWSCEQHASATGYAWHQYFSDGTQSNWLKGHYGRARAVRSLIIQ